MSVQIRLVQGLPEQLLSEGISILPKAASLLNQFTNEEVNYINRKFEKENIAVLRSWPALSVAIKGDVKENDANANLEKIRQLGADIQELLAKEKAKYTRIYDFKKDTSILLALMEGIFLASYSFQKYKSEKILNQLQVIEVFSETLTEIEIEELQNLCEAVCIARDLVNEPLIGLNAEDLANRAVELGKEKGFSVTVFDKAKINELGMGGLMAINAGSPNPPTFSILEYKPENATNAKPVVLVGKGVVYDTGGLSLKPTPNSMDFMKCDMGGAATVIGTICALADNKTPVHVIGLIPSTENRPDGNAITPGDIVTMYSGKTVEIMNTDAEGRMILADALSYAKQYDPELVIDIATLTGSAVAAIGNKGIVFMGTASSESKRKIEDVSMAVHERLVEFPLWDEYGKYLESDIADLKNLGGSDSGAISAGKFLEHFVSYPWLHLDIAAMAFLHTKEGYRIKGGTGVGIRLLYNFLASKA